MNLTTRYLGFDLPHPFIASASPLTGKLDSLKALEDSGAAAVVLPSVFEEQLRQEQQAIDAFTALQADTLTEAQSFFPDPALYERESHRTLDLVRAAREALDIPVIASLNGTSPDGWVQFSKELAAAGAQAIELNLYHIGSDPGIPGDEIEARHEETVRAVREAVDLPLAVKISPWFSSIANTARNLTQAGADALVLFNRFYLPDIDPETLTLTRTLHLSDSRDLLLPMSWIAMLRPHHSNHLALTGGIHTPLDAVKALMAGADALMSTASLLKNGPAHLTILREGLIQWMNAKGYSSIDELRGCMSRNRVPNPDLFERTNYIKLLDSWETK
jgi:dihydroorotate dehydrogenase (fumarate)